MAGNESKLVEKKGTHDQTHFDASKLLPILRVHLRAIMVMFTFSDPTSACIF
jgi:hypothetical protein